MTLRKLMPVCVGIAIVAGVGSAVSEHSVSAEKVHGRLARRLSHGMPAGEAWAVLASLDMHPAYARNSGLWLDAEPARGPFLLCGWVHDPFACFPCNRDIQANLGFD